VNKRVSNLLSKAEGCADRVEAKYFDNANEFSLYSAIQQADQAVQPMAAARQYANRWHAWPPCASRWMRSSKR
jgi:glycyl-tRNA synthetase beta chain